MKQSQQPARHAPRAYDRGSGECGPVREGTAAPSSAAIRAANRHRRRRRALVCFYLFLFFTVLSAAAVLSLTVLFKIRTIQVSGTSRYSQSQIVGASGIRTGENLFLAQTRRAEEQIRSKLPYIGSVQVHREFPAEIGITVGAAAVCGAVEYQKKYAVLGSDFRILELADKLPQGCASISGVTLRNAEAGATADFSDTTVRNTLQNVEKALKTDGLSDVTAMDFSSSSRILLVYQSRVTINLGLASDLDYKIRYAKALFDSGKIGKTEKGTLNLSTAADNDTAYFDPAAASSG